MVEPYEARHLPELPDDIIDEFRELITAVNGTAYHGASADAIIYALRWLRHNPTKAARLLATDSQLRTARAYAEIWEARARIAGWRDLNDFDRT